MDAEILEMVSKYYVKINLLSCHDLVMKTEEKMNGFGLVNISVHGRPHFEKCVDYILKNSWSCKYTIVFDVNKTRNSSLKPMGQLRREVEKIRAIHLAREKVVNVALKETRIFPYPLINLITSFMDDARCRIICYEQSIFEAFGCSDVTKIARFLDEKQCQCIFQTCFLPSLPSTLLIVSSKITLLRSQSSFLIRFIYNCLQQENNYEWCKFFKLCYFLNHDEYLCIEQDKTDKIINIPDQGKL